MSRRSTHDDRNRHFTFSQNADETEIQAFLDGAAHIEAGVRDELIADALDDFGPSDIGGPEEQRMERFEAEDLALDEAAGSTLEEIQDRNEILGELYPFKLNGNTLEYTPSQNGVYELLLSISNLQNSGEQGSLFERTATQVACRVLGRNSKAWHTGWPRSNGQPKRIKELYSNINSETGEFHWGPEAGFPEDPPPRDEKDCGIDIIVQRKLDESRIGNLFLFGQCACGNNWDSKLEEANPSTKLARYFRTVTYAPPIIAIFVPFCLSQFWINETARQKVLAFDRLRMVQISNDLDDEIPEWLHRDRILEKAKEIASQ
ncbi:MAG: hypothetical protein AOY29_08840 [Alcanivorax borkumensis]|uniref:None n=1 Tax=Alcanivorax borkumensis (strain ATCC 700651 / DSM 11573 / NCIMB 13689 / SK2) TaxID=393595 RepID=Q0VNZ2_ALCBS|nr:hypothetical protein [Alcanivorax borkumensis]OJH08793.1 MAG: hypothetical protein AOY29_08840 [Alcanivorax borkumensis]CAL17106.1 none [Alcanivorax borkumensis SK2]